MPAKLAAAIVLRVILQVFVLRPQVVTILVFYLQENTLELLTNALVLVLPALITLTSVSLVSVDIFFMVLTAKEAFIFSLSSF